MVQYNHKLHLNICIQHIHKAELHTTDAASFAGAV